MGLYLDRQKTSFRRDHQSKIVPEWSLPVLLLATVIWTPSADTGPVILRLVDLGGMFLKLSERLRG